MNAHRPSAQSEVPKLSRLFGHLGIFLGVGAIIIAIALTVFAVTPRGAGPVIGGPFALVDSNGQPVSEKSWPGKYLLIYFGYTSCPDVCPTTLSDVAGALTALGNRADRVQPLFITIDPKRDTPYVLAGYTSLFTPRLLGLTGSADAIAKVAQEYKVYYAEHRTGPGPNDYSMDHSSVIYLIAPNGRFIATVPAEQQPDAMAAEIAKHLA